MTLYRRQKRLLPISFFAFQDIITALAGTLLIVVLVLAFSRNSGDIPVNNTAHGSKRDFERNQKLITQLEQQRALAQLRLQALQNQHASLLDYEAMQEKNRQQQFAFLALQNQKQQYLQRKKKLEQALAQTAQLLRTAPEELRQKLQTALLIKTLEEKLSAVQHSYRIVPQDSKKNLLLECKRDGWLWSTAESPQARLLGKNDPTPQQKLNDLRAELKKYPPQQSRLIIAVRPSAGMMIQALKNQLRQEFPNLEILCEPLADENLGGLKF